MIIIDTALAKRQLESNPIRVALVGTGFMGRGILLQITNSTPGMEVVAVYHTDTALACVHTHRNVNIHAQICGV